jgi:hypothetical protein
MNPTSPLDRRSFLQLAAAGALLPFGRSFASTPVGGSGDALWQTRPRLSSSQSILRRVESHRPLRGGRIPEDLVRRLGTSHVSGRYHFTEEPYLVEGAKRTQALGYGCLKLWFTKLETAYSFNSKWNLPERPTLLDQARHPYFVEAFAMPFSTFFLEVQTTNASTHRPREGFSISPDLDFDEEERQVHELACHFFEEFGKRDVTFVLQNWEGDWMLRGNARTEWRRKEFPELEARADAFVRWIDVRQRAVERAREQYPGARCRVLHAVETNRVFDSLEGIATLCTHVFPRVRPDLISWSCYDGMKLEHASGDVAAVGIWQGIEIIRHYARTTLTDSEGRAQVFLGEIGVPESRFTAEQTADALDGCLAAAFALELPWIIYWQIYCNELRSGVKDRSLPTPAENLNGFWLVRPDGSAGFAADYLGRVLARAGGRL